MLESFHIQRKYKTLHISFFVFFFELMRSAYGKSLNIFFLNRNSTTNVIEVGGGEHSWTTVFHRADETWVWVSNNSDNKNKVKQALKPNGTNHLDLSTKY